MSQEPRHYHGWILQIEGSQIWFEPIDGEYNNPMTCRRQAKKVTDGDADRVVVMICKGDNTCPSRLEATALAQ